MRRAGHIVRQVLEATKEAVAPGRTTMDLERVAEKKIKDLGAKPAFKGYYDYPCVLCTSVNSEIVHGIPSETRVLKAGDIVSIDCGVILDGYYGDSAITVPVGGEITPELQKLLDVTRDSLVEGIEEPRVGNTIGDVGAAVQQLSKPTASAWYASLLDTASEPSCTKIRRFRTTVSRDTVRSCAMEW